MTITVMEAGNYFKGLLLLIRKDRKITEIESDLMKRIGRALGFEREFCDNAIREILDNPFIVDEPPVFSTKELAVRFVKDGLSVAFSDQDVHPHEEDWLRSTAEKNGLDLDALRQEWERAGRREGDPVRLEAEGLTVGYS